MDYIARIHSDFPTKFGIPRQSGLTGALISNFRPPSHPRSSAVKRAWAFSQRALRSARIRSGFPA